MSQYLRDRTKGGTWAFTTCVADPQAFALTDHIDLLRAAFHKAMRSRPFEIRAIVVLPDRIQTIWTLPSGDADYSARWAEIKSTFSRAIPRTEYIPPSRARRGERGIWQRRFWEHRLRDQAECDTLAARYYRLPVLLGLAASIGDWPYSSFHRDLRLGRLKGTGNGPASPAIRAA